MAAGVGSTGSHFLVIIIVPATGLGVLPLPELPSISLLLSNLSSQCLKATSTIIFRATQPFNTFQIPVISPMKPAMVASSSYALLTTFENLFFSYYGPFFSSQDCCRQQFCGNCNALCVGVFLWPCNTNPLRFISKT